MVKFKAGTQNIAVNALSHRPEHQTVLSKFVHICDQYDIPLVKTKSIESKMVMDTFDHTIQCTHGILCTISKHTNRINIDVHET